MFMQKSLKKGFICLAALGICAGMLFLNTGFANAGSLMDRIEKGETIRLGFANEIPMGNLLLVSDQPMKSS